ncbi:MAG: flagellar brake protein [Nitrosomonadales bacterium]|nr:flagellar brake protein [Nitrosomonadales bacterium]
MQETSSNVSLDAIKLQPGAVMQIQSDEDVQARHEVRFIGAIRGNSVLVTVPNIGGERMWMKPGLNFVIRGFNGRYAYAFTSKVILAREKPFSYVHFSYPQSVEYKVVRHALRVGVTQPATVTIPDSSPVAVTMLDLSASGSMIDSPALLGKAGDRIHLAFTVPIEEKEVNLDIAAVIRNVYQVDDAGRERVGLGFEDVSQNDNLILHYFLESRQEEIA